MGSTRAIAADRHRPGGGRRLSDRQDQASGLDAGFFRHPSLDVSIVVCTRNRCAQLQGALASLQQLRSLAEWEVVVVDNGSTDETEATIRAAQATNPRLRYCH